METIKLGYFNHSAIGDFGPIEVRRLNLGFKKSFHRSDLINVTNEYIFWFIESHIFLVGGLDKHELDGVKVKLLMPMMTLSALFVAFRSLIQEKCSSLWIPEFPE